MSTFALGLKSPEESGNLTSFLKFNSNECSVRNIHLKLHRNKIFELIGEYLLIKIHNDKLKLLSL